MEKTTSKHALKIVALILTACFVFAFTGCGDDEKAKKPKGPVEIGSISDITLEKTAISQEDVDREVDDILKSKPDRTLKKVQRAVQPGDVVDMKTITIVKKKPKNKTPHTMKNLRVNEYEMAKSFVNTLVGMKPKEIKKMEDDPKHPELYVKVQVLNVYEPGPGKLDDKFLKKMKDNNGKPLNTKEAFYENVNKYLQEDLDWDNKSDAWNQLLDASLFAMNDKGEEKVPKKDIENVISIIENYSKERAKALGYKEFSLYVASELGKTIEEYNEENEKTAKDFMKGLYIAKTLLKKNKESTEPTQEEIDEAVNNFIENLEDGLDRKQHKREYYIDNIAKGQKHFENIAIINKGKDLVLKEVLKNQK